MSGQLSRYSEACQCNFGRTKPSGYATRLADDFTLHTSINTYVISVHFAANADSCTPHHEGSSKRMIPALVRAACVSLTRASSAMASSARCAALACPACRASTSLHAAACRFLACWCSRCSADTSDCLFSASATAVCNSHHISALAVAHESFMAFASTQHGNVEMWAFQPCMSSLQE